ncbi:bifunctional [glutamine synthetase] adenylyltransferase/[glutamine synthetase]-adenylyl-L-tyrosine phosphorylase [Salinactinospora qingdaonensis]|uniref:Bifunctional glutamine synthetase adenylyltransferase/adenylyl-removing enzyme n=1 Tax=Salinactinospora qingdaonensis TaxID=702744 RepID=A0ABP7FCU9_9ACTN
MVSGYRRGTTVGTLARRGFTDTAKAERLIAEAHLDPDEHFDIVEALADAADPDLALLGITRILERCTDPVELRSVLCADADLRMRLTGILGTSVALSDHLVRHCEDWRELRGGEAERSPSPQELRGELLRAVGADPTSTAPVAGLPGDGDDSPAHALRVAYRRRVLRLAGRDLTGALSVEGVATELADLAAAMLEASLAIARAQLPEDAALCRLAVIGMGKCGARELNYVSDVDVVFVAEPTAAAAVAADDGATSAQRAATRLAAAMMRIPEETDGEGTLWEVDAALRPEGKNGPLVRPLSSHVSYYERWAKTWEFQALLKARPIAGDPDLGAAYIEAITPLVWQAAGRPNFVDDVQAMRRRVEAHIAPAEAERQLKLGPGGLRDIEFAVQLLQLVHGRTDERLRPRATLEALRALSEGGYVAREDAAGLDEAYRFLRRVEHLLQLQRLRRTHLLPATDTAEGQEQLRWLGRALGFTANPITDMTSAWRRRAAEVRRLHEKLFYRPLLNAVARLPDDEARLTPAQARDRLEALGFADPAGALRHLEALTSGVSRRAAIQRTLLPVMLGWFADAPAPDAGLLGFRQVSDALGTTPWYLRLLRDDIRVAERMARLLGTSKYTTDLLLRAPEAVAILSDDADLAPRPNATLATEAASALHRHGSPENTVAALRALRRRELLRTAAADLLGVSDISVVGNALTAVASVTIEGALRTATAEVERRCGEQLNTRLCVVAMGRFGGSELSYASDADVMFVHEPLPGVATAAATETANAVVRELRRLLELPAADPPLLVDADLRPEGKSGPMVRTLESYTAYYTRWSSSWESQALLRAVPVAGDAGLGERFTAMIDPIRYPAGGIDSTTVREIRRLKARMEAERLPRGTDPTLHTKLGRGGLSDVEWVAQLIQLRHAHEIPQLRTTQTLGALMVATTEGLLDPEDAAILDSAWRMAARVRGAITLVRGKSSDSIPTDLRERSAIAGALGYRVQEGQDAGPAELLLEDYRRITRRARGVMERVFYDD